MTLLIFISLILNPFSELEAENEALRWELQERINELKRLERFVYDYNLEVNTTIIRAFNEVSLMEVREQPYLMEEL